MSDKWHLEGGEVFDSEQRGVALISTTYLARGAGPLIAAAPDLLEALKAADQFITNGIEFGFIRMPDAKTSDSAHQTPDKVRAAIAKAKGRP